MRTQETTIDITTYMGTNEEEVMHQAAGQIRSQ
jgi:hypothetical protein